MMQRPVDLFDEYGIGKLSQQKKLLWIFLLISLLFNLFQAVV